MSERLESRDMHGTVSNLKTHACGRSLLSEDRWRLIAASLRLSTRELQIVQCVFDGANEATVARELGISCHTVHTYVRRLYRKLGVRDRCELLIQVFASYMSLDRRR